jgi:hypothetical protein
MLLLVDYGLKDFPTKGRTCVDMNNVLYYTVASYGVIFYFSGGTSLEIPQHQSTKLYASIVSQLEDYEKKRGEG